MAEEIIKISELTQGTPDDTDVIPYVDLSSNTTKKALKSELKGDKGEAATVDAGTTTTLAAGQSATVTNVGTTAAAIFNFAIPQGIQGIQGENGACVESVAFVGNDIVFTLDDASTVTLTNAKVDLKGETGATGAVIESAEFVGDDLVFTLSDASTVTVTGAKTDLKGDKGDTGLTGVDWQGNWSAGTYTATQGVAHNGSSWIAKTTTTEEPSISATDWDLVALKGTDGAGSGDVVGPVASTNNNIAVFDGTTGKLIKDGGATLASKQDALDYIPEDVSNKRTSFQATPTDTAYASEKLVKDSLDNKQNILAEGPFADGDKTKLDNQSGTNTGDETVATGTEVNTGTDNEKMVTPKALADSDYIKDSYLSSNNYQQIEVSSTEPSSPTTGDLWLDLS